MDFSITFSLVIASFLIYRIYLSWEQHNNIVQPIIHINSHNVQQNENNLLATFLITLGAVGLIYMLLASA